MGNIQYIDNFERWSYNHFKRPAVASCAIIHYNGEVLLIKRTPKTRAYPDEWCFPGGFINTDIETIEECCIRELKEETGVTCQVSQLNFLTIVSGPKVDPRAHVICPVYFITLSERPIVTASDDAVSYMWVQLTRLTSGNFKLAFNHNELAILFEQRINAHV